MPKWWSSSPWITRRFRGTTIPRAFLINSFILATIATISIQVDLATHDLNLAEKGTVVFFSSFFSALIVFIIMYLLFNYGGNMLVSQRLD